MTLAGYKPQLRAPPPLELHSRAAPSVEAHQSFNGSNTGRNSGGSEDFFMGDFLGLIFNSLIYFSSRPNFQILIYCWDFVSSRFSSCENLCCFNYQNQIYNISQHVSEKVLSPNSIQTQYSCIWIMTVVQSLLNTGHVCYSDSK